MTQRFDIMATLQPALAGLRRAGKVDGPFDEALLELVKVRVSQLNGCAYCTELHTRRGIAAGASEFHMRALVGWRDIADLTPETRTALEVAEALTTLDGRPDPGPVLDAAKSTLGEDGLAQVVSAVAVIGAFNRIMRAAGLPPDPDAE